MPCGECGTNSTTRRIVVSTYMYVIVVLAGLVGLVRLIAGEGHREPWEEDYSAPAPSRVTHVAQCIVFSAIN